MKAEQQPAFSPDTAGPTLVRRVAEGDPDSWTILTRIYAPIVYRWARQAGIAEDLCSDITQEVFLTVFRSLPAKRDSRFRHWLWRIFRSRVIDRHRGECGEAVSRGGTTAQQFLMQLAEEPASEETAEGREECRETRLRALLAFQEQFDSHVWDCFWRTVILCESPKDVANDLGISVWAVYKNRSRCQERLQTELAPLGIDVSLEERDP